MISWAKLKKMVQDDGDKINLDIKAPDGTPVREEGEGKEGKAEARRQEEEMREWGSIELQVVQSYWIIECV